MSTWSQRPFQKKETYPVLPPHCSGLIRNGTKRWLWPSRKQHKEWITGRRYFDMTDYEGWKVLRAWIRALMEAERDEHVNAAPYERSERRRIRVAVAGAATSAR